ncbi:MAG: ABC transporter permease [Wujia sp.]
MKESNLKGFGAVFKHNLRLKMKSTKYVASTIVVSLVLFIGMALLIFFTSKNSAEKEKYSFNVSEVYVVDETGLGIPDYKMMAAALGFDYAKDTKFISSDKAAKELIKDENVSYMVVQTKNEDGYVLQLVTGSNLSDSNTQRDKNLDDLKELMVMGFQNHIYMTSGLSEEQIVQALLPVGADVQKIGEETEDEGKLIVAIVLVYLFVMILYFMVLIYGTEICSDVPIEKTSKLVEQLLMSVSPYALISGKVLAKIFGCVVQFLIWVVSLILGVLAGDFIVRSVYSLDHSMVSTALEYLKKWFEGMGFTVPAIIMTVVLTIAGLVMYLLLSGLAGAFLTKPEQSGNVQSIFVLPLVIAFLAINFSSGIMEGRYDIPISYNMIPFTSAMTAPASVLIGTLSIPMAFVSLAIMVVCCMLILWLSAKIYEGLLFFNGNKLKTKDIINIFKR